MSKRYTAIPFSSIVGSGVFDSEAKQIMVLVPNRGSAKETEALAKICADAINREWSGKKKREATHD